MNSAKVEKEDVDWLNDSKKTRDITQEILTFGVSQNQIKLIIGLLALELEDRDMMLAVKKCVDEAESTDNTHENKILYIEGDE